MSNEIRVKYKHCMCIEDICIMAFCYNIYILFDWDIKTGKILILFDSTLRFLQGRKQSVGIRKMQIILPVFVVPYLFLEKLSTHFTAGVCRRAGEKQSL